MHTLLIRRVSDIELVHDLLAVGLDGFDTDFQNRRDLLGRMTVCDELQYL